MTWGWGGAVSTATRVIRRLLEETGGDQPGDGCTVGIRDRRANDRLLFWAMAYTLDSTVAGCHNLAFHVEPGQTRAHAAAADHSLLVNRVAAVVLHTPRPNGLRIALLPSLHSLEPRPDALTLRAGGQKPSRAGLQKPRLLLE